MRSDPSAPHLVPCLPGPAHQHDEHEPKNHPQSHDDKGDSSHHAGFQQDVLEFAGRAVINQNALEQRQTKRNGKDLFLLPLYVRLLYFRDGWGNNTPTAPCLCFPALGTPSPPSSRSSPCMARGIVSSAAQRQRRF